MPKTCTIVPITRPPPLPIPSDACTVNVPFTGVGYTIIQISPTQRLITWDVGVRALFRCVCTDVDKITICCEDNPSCCPCEEPIPVTCCLNPVPFLLFATFTGGSGPGCMNGTHVLTYAGADGGHHWDGVCQYEITGDPTSWFFPRLLCLDPTGWVLFVEYGISGEDCVGASNSTTNTTNCDTLPCSPGGGTCDPFNLVFPPEGWNPPAAGSCLYEAIRAVIED